MARRRYVENEPRGWYFFTVDEIINRAVLKLRSRRGRFLLTLFAFALAAVVIVIPLTRKPARAANAATTSGTDNLPGDVAVPPLAVAHPAPGLPIDVGGGLPTRRFGPPIATTSPPTTTATTTTTTVAPSTTVPTTTAPAASHNPPSNSNPPPPPPPASTGPPDTGVAVPVG
jgi:hypothetical protein